MAEPTDAEAQAVLQSLTRTLNADIRAEEEFDQVKPFLAHYTSLDTLEKILRTNEIWFLNPLLMNDWRSFGSAS